MSKTRINLLPWREEHRKQQNIEYGIYAAAAALVVAALFGLVYLFYIDRTNHQELRNQRLESEIKILDGKLRSIQELEETRKRLKARIDVIQKLQSSRPQAVHLFEEVVVTIPPGIWLTSFKQTQNKITINGVTESNARVSNYMRNLEASDWLSSPELVYLRKSQISDKRGAADFELNVTLINPNVKEEQ